MKNAVSILFHNKEQIFIKLPKISGIYFQRFSHFSDSIIKTKIDFPNIINLNNFCDNDYFKDNDVFKLLDLVNQTGNINCGHHLIYINLSYFSYNFNDQYINEITKEDSS